MSHAPSDIRPGTSVQNLSFGQITTEITARGHIADAEGLIDLLLTTANAAISAELISHNLAGQSIQEPVGSYSQPIRLSDERTIGEATINIVVSIELQRQAPVTTLETIFKESVLPMLAKAAAQHLEQTTATMPRAAQHTLLEGALGLRLPSTMSELLREGASTAVISGRSTTRQTKGI